MPFGSTYSSLTNRWRGATRWSSRAGSTATLTFRGTGIAWVAPVGPTRGRAAVSIDGVVVATIDLHATSNYFGPGHRIRLEVASSNFPRFDRNLNTGGRNYDETAWMVARNTVHHSA